MTALSMHVTVTLADGDVIETHPTAADLMRYELHAHNEKLPQDAESLPFLRSAFCAWSWAKRRKLTTLTWRDWYTALDDLDVQNPDADADPSEPEDPSPAH